VLHDRWPEFPVTVLLKNLMDRLLDLLPLLNLGWKNIGKATRFLVRLFAWCHGNGDREMMCKKYRDLLVTLFAMDTGQRA
jgi:hypothetical protein